MSIAAFINKKSLQKAETEAVTVRLASTTVAEIDEFSLTLGTTRQEVITELLEDALRGALAIYEKEQNKGALMPLAEETTKDTQRYFLLNTNKKNDPADHFYMHSKGVAAAFYDNWNTKIDGLRKGDIVFLYESGMGIVGFGKASGTTEIKAKDGVDGVVHEQKLEPYNQVQPLSAREIKKLTGANLCYLQTMVRVNSEAGALIEKSFA